MIRAVDLAMPIQRATEMNQNQRGEQRPEVQHQQFAARMNKEQEMQQQTVQQTPQSEEAMIQKDGRGNSGQKQSKNKKKSKKDQKPATSARTSTSMFDLSV